MWNTPIRFLMENKKSENSGKAFDLTVLKRIFAYTKPYRGKFFSAVLITLFLSALSISRPIIIRQTIDNYITNKDEQMVLLFSSILLSTLIFESVLQYSNSVITGFIGQSIVRDLRKQVYAHILRFKTKVFDNTPIGTLVTRSVSDIEALSDVFAQGFIVIMGDIVTLLVFAVTMFLVNWQLALVVLITVPMLMLATRFFKQGVKKSFTEVRNAVANLNAFVQEHIQGMKIVQVFAREEQEYKKFERINESHKLSNIKSIWYYSVFFPIVEILSSVAIALIILYGGIFDSLSISPGEITFFIMLTNMLFRPIRMLADRLNTLQMGVVSAERVFKILDTKETITQNGSIRKKITGKIEFDKVTFAYNNQDYVIKNLSFKINPGEKVAIVGATGAGKSSIINLIGRFYEFNSGNIRIDDVDIRDYSEQSLKEQIAIVHQDVFLFSDSLLNNITFGDTHFSKASIYQASAVIGADKFISKLPGGLDFNPGERGALLSTGQRQLISFVRAYVKNPSVLILDEATSSIDTESEQLIQQATRELTKGRTSFIIAHRLATIKDCDRILVMDNGELAEEGTLSDLLGREGKFKTLYEHQYQN